MKVTFFTAYPKTVLFLLSCECVVSEPLADSVITRGGHIEISYPDDTRYREVLGWMSGAVGCGLISQTDIER